MNKKINLKEDWQYNDWPDVDINGNVINKKSTKLTESASGRRQLTEAVEFTQEKNWSSGAYEISGEIDKISVDDLYNSLLDLSYEYEDGEGMDTYVSFAKSEATTLALQALDDFTKDDILDDDGVAYTLAGDMQSVLDALASIDLTTVLTNVDIGAQSFTLEDDEDDED